MRKNIPVTIRNYFNTAHAGTSITSVRRRRTPLRNRILTCDERARSVVCELPQQLSAPA
jgi:aspartokinase